MFKKVFMSLFLAGAICMSTQAWAFSCYRSFYNNSKGTWTINVAPPGSHGKFYFLGSETGVSCSGRDCTLQPGQKVRVQYTYDGGWTSGLIKITDKNSKSATYYYNNGIVNKCPEIKGGGDIVQTGPAAGDITFVGAYY